VQNIEQANEASPRSEQSFGKVMPQVLEVESSNDAMNTFDNTNTVEKPDTKRTNPAGSFGSGDDSQCTESMPQISVMAAPVSSGFVLNAQSPP